METVRKIHTPFFVPCLLCGVDSGPIKTFLFLFIGSLVLCTVMLLIWAMGSGRLKDDGKNGELPLEAENIKGES